MYEKDIFLQIYIGYNFIASGTVNKVQEMHGGFHDKDYAKKIFINNNVLY